MMDPNPFKRDEREDMRRFWWRATGAVGLLFWLAIAGALVMR